MVEATNNSSFKDLVNEQKEANKQSGFIKDILSKMLVSQQQEVVDKGGIENLQIEEWPEANTYTNHWDSPSRMKHLTKYHAEIWRETEAHVREWIPSAKSFSRSSLYGIRVYTKDSILATHVDRDPLITSAIINVAQDVDEPWPIEVISHDGRAYNVTVSIRNHYVYTFNFIKSDKSSNSSQNPT